MLIQVNELEDLVGNMYEVDIKTMNFSTVQYCIIQLINILFELMYILNEMLILLDKTFFVRNNL